MKQRITIAYEEDDGQVCHSTPLATLTLDQAGDWKPEYSKFWHQDAHGHNGLNLRDALADCARILDHELNGDES